MAAKKRTLSLNEDLDAKLIELCDALSVSPNNYITNVLAKAVMTDRTALVTQKASNEGVQEMLALFGQALESDGKEEGL